MLCPNAVRMAIGEVLSYVSTCGRNSRTNAGASFCTRVFGTSSRDEIVEKSNSWRESSEGDFETDKSAPWKIT